MAKVGDFFSFDHNSRDFTEYSAILQELEDCVICPRQCHANRLTGRAGYCRSDASFNIASICIHRGEEPVISGKNGICNIFFTNCNLQCIYCQNHQISDNRIERSGFQLQLAEVVRSIASYLESGITHVGFVSPSHFIPQVRIIIMAIETMGYNPIWVYNTNGYDKPESLRMLEGIIDVYLPDLKYMENQPAWELSGARDYPEVAGKALKEMYRQKGSALHLNNEDNAVSGIVVRHLVLPGYLENSLKVIRFLAEEISPKIHISLMSQYYPVPKVNHHPRLAHPLKREDYQKVADEMDNLGMYNGWIQEFESSDYYRPDFDQDHPFE